MDLVALNIQRGRDHGLPSYNVMRSRLGLVPVASFVDVTLNATLQSILQSLYSTPSQMDLWVGILCEDPTGDSVLGELGSTIIRDQFRVLRNGDRFWFERRLSGHVLSYIKSVRLGSILQLNTQQAFPKHVFKVPKSTY